MRIIITAALIVSAFCRVQAEEPLRDATESAKKTTFADKQWDRSIWRPLRLPNQSAIRPFIQKADCLATEAFTQDDIKAQQDNVLLVTPCGSSTAQIQATFSIGPEPGAAAGFFIGENCTEDTLLSGTVVFVAANRLAIWEVVSDEKTRETKYTHLVQLAHAFPIGEKHVFTCSFDRKGGLAVRVDDTAVLSLRKCRVGSSVGVWGCHGSTSFYDFAQQHTATLSAVAP